MASLWLLNLDAELEWAAKRRGPSYAPTREVRSILAGAGSLATGLLGPGDRWLEPSGSAWIPGAEWIGRAFCPSPDARQRFADLGVETELWPDLAIVEQANDRSFLFEHHLAPPASMHWTDVDDCVAFLAKERAGGDWLAKRALGTAGRGQRALRPGALSAADQDWLRASFELGAVIVEPRRKLVAEYSLHGRLHPGGQVLRGRPLRFTTKQGSYRSAVPIDANELDGHAWARFEHAFISSANELHRSGYFGPFGIDAYCWQEGSATYFEPCSELNARYTLAWGIGMELAGPEALRPYRQTSDECTSDAELMQ